MTSASNEGRGKSAPAGGRRLIEDYLPIREISAEATREKSLRKGHISTLHLWWARRPLVACRAAVYGALVPASQFVSDGASDAQKRSLGRANAAKFLAALCKYPAQESYLEQARRHIIEAHAERLSAETGKPVTADDIAAGRAPRPKVLDMFAGGGAIPLEALRLGCDAYALDLNPVAHIIELCTLVYPQKYGKPDKDAKGSAADGAWAGLAEEVRRWGEWAVKKVREEIGHLYPPIPDPASKGQRGGEGDGLFGGEGQLPPGYLQPLAYLWTRTVQCKNPQCGADVPLVRQTWLRKKKGRYAALKMVAPQGSKRVRFELAEADREKALGFDPAAFSKGGNAACPFCGTVADSAHVKREGM
jgi:putative DNA methylase